MRNAIRLLLRSDRTSAFQAIAVICQRSGTQGSSKTLEIPVGLHQKRRMASSQPSIACYAYWPVRFFYLCLSFLFAICHCSLSTAVLNNLLTSCDSLFLRGCFLPFNHEFLVTFYRPLKKTDKTFPPINNVERYSKVNNHIGIFLERVH